MTILRPKIGDVFVAKPAALGSYVEHDCEFRVGCMQEGEASIGLISAVRQPNWHGLDGATDHGHGWWVTHSELAGNFREIASNVVITKTIMYKKHNLKGLKANTITRDSTGKFYFVELEENVGGGSADGLGKHGHCVMVPTNAIGPGQKKEKKKS